MLISCGTVSRVFHTLKLVKFYIELDWQQAIMKQIKDWNVRRNKSDILLDRELQFYFVSRMEELGRIERFKFLYFLQHFISVLLIVLLLKWIGFPPQGFNWHPIMMTIGMVLLYGNCKLLFYFIEMNQIFDFNFRQQFSFIEDSDTGVK